MRKNSGLSLLETLTALFILTVVAWSVVYLYSSILKGSKTSDERRAAVAHTESLLKIWKQRAKTPWIIDPVVSNEAYSVNGNYGEYFYRVEVGQRIENPGYDTNDPNSPSHLDLRALRVELHYTDDNKEKVISLNGSISR